MVLNTKRNGKENQSGISSENFISLNTLAGEINNLMEFLKVNKSFTRTILITSQEDF